MRSFFNQNKAFPAATSLSLKTFSDIPVKEAFIEQNLLSIVNNILTDAFAIGLAQNETSAPLLPLSIRNKNGSPTGVYSAFEIAQKALLSGAVDFSFLSESGIGYVLGANSPKGYPVFSAKSPYTLKDALPLPLYELLRVPLGILYSLFKNLSVKESLYDGKFIVYLNNLRASFLAERPSSFEESRKSIESQLAGIINEKNNLWVFDASDRLEAPQLVDNNLKETLSFAYSEISRILGIPMTRLMGKSPDGMNATGESDTEFYRLTLKSLLNSLILPIVKIADPHATLKKSFQIPDIQAKLDALTTLQSLTILDPETVQMLVGGILESCYE